MLVLITGLPGTGKSTISYRLARNIRASVLRTDEVRKRILEPLTYSEEEKELVYKATFLIAEHLLRARRNVIIDGTFYKMELRRRIYSIAAATRSEMTVVECIAPESVIKRRMERRARRRTLSDADYEVYKKVKVQYEPIKREHIILDTSNPLRDNLSELYNKMDLQKWSRR
ncbi:MAG: AAA family ATPase [Candidatus Hydrothermarchaeales archaeon]